MIPPDVLSPLLAMVEAAAERGAARALAAHSAPGPAAARDVDRHELARVLGVSTATVGRLQKEGAPHSFVGASPRFDVEAVRQWLAARGQKGTSCAPATKRAIAGVRLLSRGGRTG